MATRKHLGRSRALRPPAEGLEGRQLLSATVSGTDTAGDHWTLTLGPRGLQVIKQNDSTGSPGALNSATEINSIIISGTDPTDSRLTGKVVPAAGSGGRIFFQNLTELPNISERLGIGLGIQSINIPNFYLGVHRRDRTTSGDRSRWPRSRSPTGSTRSASAGSTPPTSSGPTPPRAPPRTARTTSSWSGWAFP